jgi:hypothetical protein
MEPPMPISKPHVCQCANCQSPDAHPDKKLHLQMNLLLTRLDEQQRRWYVAVEANRIGYGGNNLLSQITGLDEKTIQRGREELERNFADRPVDQVRSDGAGRQPVEKKTRR